MELWQVIFVGIGAAAVFGIVRGITLPMFRIMALDLALVGRRASANSSRKCGIHKQVVADITADLRTLARLERLTFSAPDPLLAKALHSIIAEVGRR